MSVCTPIALAVASAIHRCATMGNGLVEVMKATVTGRKRKDSGIVADAACTTSHISMRYRMVS